MKIILQFLILILTTSGFAQDGSIDSSFNSPTGASNGNVNAVVLQSDGKIIVGGDFSLLNNTPSSKLGRLNSDGTFDTTFNLGSGFNHTVNSISTQSDGKILVVGDFTDYKGSAKSRIVRLNTNGNIDPTFNIGTGANNNIYAATIQADGKILVVGDFTSFNGSAKNKIVRLNADGSIDSTFLTTGANSAIYSCILQSDGKILVAGNFTLLNGTAKNRIARLNSDGTLDPTFNSAIAANNSVKTISLQSDGKIVIGGNFTSYNGISANRIARLNSDSTLDLNFNSGDGFNAVVNSIVTQSDGKLLIGGNFAYYNNIDSNRMARLNSDGLLDTAFSSGTNSGTNADVNTIAIQPNGKIIVGGGFSMINDFSRNRLARLNANGNVDTGFYPFLINGTSTNERVRAITMQSNGKIIIGGMFDTYNGLPSKNIARLNANGTVDPTFNIGLGANAGVLKIAVLASNKIIIVGDFTSYNGINVNRIARLNTDGTLDTTFNAGGSGVNSAIHSVAIQADGKILIGGDFTNVNGFAKMFFARLNPNGSFDNSFYADAEGGVYTIEAQSDDKIIIGGSFATYNGILTGNVARLFPNGIIDIAFNASGAGPDYVVYATATQSDGKIVLVGSFSNYNNVAKKGIVRINTDGSIDSTFNSTTLFGAMTVEDVVIQSDGKIIIGGAFSAYNGFTGKNIMRLNTDGSLDNTFVQGTGFNAFVSVLTLQSNDRILVGGNFTEYNGISTNYITRLHTANNLSVKEFHNEHKVQVYPNPASDYVRFSLPNGVNILSIDIFDISGKKLDISMLNESTIDVKKYSNGIYFLNIKTDNAILTTKFIKR